MPPRPTLPHPSLQLKFHQLSGDVACNNAQTQVTQDKSCNSPLTVQACMNVHIWACTPAYLIHLWPKHPKKKHCPVKKKGFVTTCAEIMCLWRKLLNNNTDLNTSSLVCHGGKVNRWGFDRPGCSGLALLTEAGLWRYYTTCLPTRQWSELRSWYIYRCCVERMRGYSGVKKPRGRVKPLSSGSPLFSFPWQAFCGGGWRALQPRQSTFPMPASRSSGSLIAGVNPVQSLTAQNSRQEEPFVYWPQLLQPLLIIYIRVVATLYPTTRQCHRREM